MFTLVVISEGCAAHYCNELEKIAAWDILIQTFTSISFVHVSLFCYKHNRTEVFFCDKERVSPTVRDYNKN